MFDRVRNTPQIVMIIVPLFRDKPLALYIFSNDYSVTERVTNETYSGGVCVNDALVHAAGKVPFVSFCTASLSVFPLCFSIL